MDILRANREKVKARAEAEKARAEIDKTKAQAQLQAEKTKGNNSDSLTSGRQLNTNPGEDAGSEVGMVEDQPKFMASLMKKAIPIYFEFWLLFFNILAVSISLNCNRDTKIVFKIVFALIAFCLGIFYVMYYFTKVAIFKSEPCEFNNVGFFC